ELYRQFAVTVTIAVIISGFVALTITPALCAILLKPIDNTSKSSPFFSWFNRNLTAFTMRFLSLVRTALKHRIASAVLLVLVVIGGWQLLQKTPTAFVPKEDQGILYVAVQLPEGAAFPRTEKVGTELLEKIQSLEPIKNVVTMMGYDMLSGDVRSNSVTFIAQLKPWEERTVTIDEIKTIITGYLSQHPEAKGIVTAPGGMPGLGSTN
ncbi:Acriflavin resistance protein, partial [gut metagenome]